MNSLIIGTMEEFAGSEKSHLTSSLADEMKHLSCRPDARETVAIICSENTKTRAEELNVGNNIQDSKGSNVKREIIICKDLGCFSDELLKRCERFYILVDSSLMAIVMSKRNFHSEVDEFFESVEKNGKKVVVCRDLGPDENEEAIDFYARLPRNCRLWHNEVNLNFIGPSNSTIEDGGNYVQPEEKKKVKEEKVDEEKKEEKKEEEEKVKEETTTSTNEVPGVGRCVQVGSHQTMKVTSTSSKPLQIEQYGDNNAVSIKIGPKVKNNVRFVVNSEQLSNEDEEAITKDLKRDECLRISMKSSGCTSVSITKGSIIIEMDVEPGTNMDKEWLFSLFTLLFEERLRKLFPKGISLDVEVEKTWTVTLQEIESAKKSDLQAQCVPKEKYDTLLKENTELKEKIEESTVKSDLHALCVPKEKYDAVLKDKNELKGKIQATEKMVQRRRLMSFPLEQYFALVKENQEMRRKIEDSEVIPRQRLIGGRLEEFPKIGMRAGEKRYVTERRRSLKGLESPVTEHPIKKENVYRKEFSKWISESTPPLAVKTASKESKLKGALTKVGQDLQTQFNLCLFLVFSSLICMIVFFSFIMFNV